MSDRSSSDEDLAERALSIWAGNADLGLEDAWRQVSDDPMPGELEAHVLSVWRDTAPEDVPVVAHDRWRGRAGAEHG